MVLKFCLPAIDHAEGTASRLAVSGSQGTRRRSLRRRAARRYIAIPGSPRGRLSRPPRFLHILCRQAIESIRPPIPTAFTIAEALEERGRPGRMPDALRLKASVQPCAGRRGMGPRRGVGQGAGRRKERSRHRHAPEAPTGLSKTTAANASAETARARRIETPPFGAHPDPSASNDPGTGGPSPPTENGARTTAEGPGRPSRRLMASNQASLSPRRNQIPNEPQGQTGPLGAKQTIGLPGVKPASRDSRRSAMGGGASPAQALAGFEQLAPEQLRLTHPKLQDSQLGPHQER